MEDKRKTKLTEMRKRQISRGKTGGIGNWGVNQFIKDCTRQVRWLFNNSNKCTMVVSEKNVRVLEAHFKNQLEAEDRKLQLAIDLIKDFHGEEGWGSFLMDSPIMNQLTK